MQMHALLLITQTEKHLLHEITITSLRFSSEIFEPAGFTTFSYLNETVLQDRTFRLPESDRGY
jgi:hypothetical protein